MEDERTMIIIQEIKYWKEHKLLPEQYCDFLLALYTKGADLDSSPKRITRSTRIRDAFNMTLFLFYLVLLLPFSFLVLYFTEFHVYLQLGILTLFLSTSIIGFQYLKRRGWIYHHVALMVSFLLALLLSTHMGQLIYGNHTILNGIIVLNFLVWVFIGQKYKLKYLLISGTLGIVFVFLYIIISI